MATGPGNDSLLRRKDLRAPHPPYLAKRTATGWILVLPIDNRLTAGTGNPGFGLLPLGGKFLAPHYFLLPAAVGEEAKVTDLHEAARQDMQKKPKYEFEGIQGHISCLVFSGIVFPAKGHFAVLK